MIVVVDYDSGNTGSVLNMLKRIGASAIISSQPEDILNADKIIIPGVGAFDQSMLKLHELNLVNPLNDVALNKKVPILGICLGMHLFTESSEEGSLPGFGWIKGKTVRFNFSNSFENLKVPHMGWNHVKPLKEDHIFMNAKEDMRFYFVHSYHVECSDPNNIIANSFYGYEFPCAIRLNNIFGVQFHPEKSHSSGLHLLKNFWEM